MRIVTVLAMAGVLSGCASVTWNKPGATQADFDQEKLLCQYEATKATASGGNFGMSTAIGAGIAEGLKQGEIITLCLQTRGWTRQAAR